MEIYLHRMTQFCKIHTYKHTLTHKQLKYQKGIHKHVTNNYLLVGDYGQLLVSAVYYSISPNFYSEQLLILLLKNDEKGNGGIKCKELRKNKIIYQLILAIQ